MNTSPAQLAILLLLLLAPTPNSFDIANDSCSLVRASFPPLLDAADEAKALVDAAPGGGHQQQQPNAADEDRWWQRVANSGDVVRVVDADDGQLVPVFGQRSFHPRQRPRLPYQHGQQQHQQQPAMRMSPPEQRYLHHLENAPVDSGKEQQQQQQKQQQQRQLSSDCLYAEFDRKMEQMGDYARDRLDSTQQRWHRQQLSGMPLQSAVPYSQPSVGKDYRLDVDSSADRQHNIHPQQHQQQPALWPTDSDESAVRQKRRTKAAATTARQSQQQSASIKFRMGKVLNVLVPQLSPNAAGHHPPQLYAAEGHNSATAINVYKQTVGHKSATAAEKHRRRVDKLIENPTGFGRRVLTLQPPPPPPPLPESHMQQSQARGQQLHRQVAAVPVRVPGHSRQPSAADGDDGGGADEEADNDVRDADGAGGDQEPAEFIVRNACEICPAQQRAGSRRAGQPCCGGNKTKRQTDAIQFNQLQQQRTQKRVVQSSSRQPSAVNRLQPNRAAASVFPAVVVETPPNLASYKKLMLRTNDNEPNELDANAPTAAVAASKERTYADFLNYFERQRKEQHQQQLQLQSEQLAQQGRLNGLQLQRMANTSGFNVSATEAPTTTTTTATTATAANEPEHWAPANSSDTANRLSSSWPPSPPAIPADCAKYLDADNSSAAVLRRVLDELERIRAEAHGAGSATPEGAPCSILGSWNSEIIGLRFDISDARQASDLADAGLSHVAATNNASIPPTPITLGARSSRLSAFAALANSGDEDEADDGAVAPTSGQPANGTQRPAALAAVGGGLRDLTVRLVEHNPPRRSALMDTNWTCNGQALQHSAASVGVGGPFTLVATRPHDKTMATFTGVCKTCGGVETIFGTWNFVRPLRDCRDLQTALETRRDIFRKELLYVKKAQKLQQLQMQQQQQQIQSPTNDSGIDRLQQQPQQTAPTEASTSTVASPANERKTIHSARWARSHDGAAADDGYGRDGDGDGGGHADGDDNDAAADDY